MPRTPRIEIEYCTQCRWLLRAAWMAQELLTTFAEEIGELGLVPGTGGVFEVRVDDEVIWSRASKACFPEIKELKQLVRDRISPGRDLTLIAPVTTERRRVEGCYAVVTAYSADSSRQCLSRVHSGWLHRRNPPTIASALLPRRAPAGRALRCLVWPPPSVT